MLSRRRFLASAAGAGVGRAAAAARPNIVMVLLDDQRWDAFSASGVRGIFDFLKTPHMDRLAAEGIHFRNTFCTTSLCSPSRASILSGQWVHTHGVHSLAGDLADGTATFPELLRQAGYDTGFVGKWHLGRESEVPDAAFGFWAAFRGQGTYFDPLLNVNGERTPTSGYVTDILTNYAIDFVKKRRERPFFLLLSHKAAHDPCTPPKEPESLFEDVRVEYPPSYHERHDDKPSWYLNFHDHDAFHYMYHPREKFEKYVKDYARTLVSVDENLGRLLGALEESGQLGNTVIFWLADNGHFMAEHQFFSKMIMYEESIRIPLLVRDPRGKQRGVRREEFILNVDLAPTILEIAGVAAPREMEGRSFARMLSGGRIRGWRKSFLYEYEDGTPSWGLPQLEGVRTADGWQYTRYPDWEQMYDIYADPTQVRNLAQDPRYAGKKRQLMGELRRLGGGRRALQPGGAYKRRSEAVHTPHLPDFR